jgi:hypothetical protein
MPTPDNLKAAIKIILEVAGVLSVLTFIIVFSFNYFLTQHPEAKPTNPGNNTLDVSPDINLSWVPENRPSGIANLVYSYSKGSIDLIPSVVYEIFLGTKRDGFQLDGSKSSKQDGGDLYYKPKIKFLPNTTYYWKIHYNNYLWNGEGESEIFIFRTASKPIINTYPNTTIRIHPGDCIRIGWDAINANKTYFFDPNKISDEVQYLANDSTDVCPMSSTTYTIKAKNEYGPSDKIIRIEVSRNPTISQFYPDRSNIAGGQSTSLHYLVYGANRVHISPDINISLDPFGGDVRISPLETTTYKLEAYGKDNIGYSNESKTVFLTNS